MMRHPPSPQEAIRLSLAHNHAAPLIIVNSDQSLSVAVHTDVRRWAPKQCWVTSSEHDRATDLFCEPHGSIGGPMPGLCGRT